MTSQRAAVAIVLGVTACGDATAPPVVGAPAALQIVSGDLQSDTVAHELPEPLVVRVMDANDQPVQGQVINFRVIVGGGSVFAGVALTDSAGEARERWTLGTVAGDTQTVEARAVDTQTGESLVFGRFRATGLADISATVALAPATPADSATFVGGDSVLTGDSLSLSVAARDRHGNLKDDPAVTWTTSDPAVATVSSTGVVRVLQPGPVAITATVDTAAGSAALVGQLRVPVALDVVAGAGQSDTVDATLATPLDVRAVDRRGRGFEGVEITFRGLNSAPADTMPGCGCTAVLTDADGLAATAWVLGVLAGGASMDVVGRSPAGGAVFDSVRVPAAVLRGAADNMTKISGGGSTTGLIVGIRDRHGNPVSAVVVAWTITSGTGTLSDALSVSNINGLAGTSVTSATGTVTVEASAPGLNGSPVSFTATVTASGFALDFNQSWVTIPAHPDFDVTTTWSVEAWVKPRNADGGTQHVVSKWNGGGNASYELEVRNGRFGVGIHDGVNITQLVPSKGAIVNDTWQHIAATFANGTLRLYINGVLDTTFINSQTPMVSDRPVSIGREGEPFGGWRYDGVIDEVRIWNVTRSSADITASWDQRLTGSESGLVGYWRFDEGSGDVAFDATGRGHHGQLGNAVGADANDPQWTTDVPPIP